MEGVSLKNPKAQLVGEEDEKDRNLFPFLETPQESLRLTHNAWIISHKKDD